MNRVFRLSIYVGAAFALCTVATDGAYAGPYWTIDNDPLIGEATLISHTPESGVERLYASAGRLNLECRKMESEGSILGDAGETGDIAIAFSGCEVIDEPLCRVKEPIAMEAQDSLAYWPGNRERIVSVLEPRNAGVFVTITTEGTECAATGSYSIDGGTIGEITPVKESASSLTVSFKCEKERQIPVEYENERGEIMKDELTFGQVPACLEAEGTVELSGAASDRMLGVAAGRTPITFHEISTTGPTVPVGTTLVGKGSNFVIHLGSSEVVCSNGAFEGPLEVVKGSADETAVTKVEFTGPEGPSKTQCATTFAGKPTASISANTPWRLNSFSWKGIPDQSWQEILYPPKGQIILTVTLNNGVTCSYAAPRLPVESPQSGPPLILKMASQEMTEENVTAPCEATAELDGEFIVKTGTGQELAITNP